MQNVTELIENIIHGSGSVALSLYQGEHRSLIQSTDIDVDGSNNGTNTWGSQTGFVADHIWEFRVSSLCYGENGIIVKSANSSTFTYTQKSCSDIAAQGGTNVSLANSGCAGQIDPQLQAWN